MNDNEIKRPEELAHEAQVRLEEILNLLSDPWDKVKP